MDITYIFLALFIILAFLMAHQESKKRKISFWKAILFCVLLSPIIGFFIISNYPLRNAPGCQWCGNSENEAEYCGICGKNEEGNLRG
ncbi:MAG: hypothetical protein MH137_06780 [Flavobacteriales bacterium]|nr:hypothetical protein [Flavobacteriales bacterium]